MRRNPDRRGRTFAADPLAALAPLGGGVVRVRAGELFIHQGMPVDNLYCLLSGKVKVETTELNGRSLLVCFSQAPSFLGDVEIFRDDLLAGCTVTALNDLELWRIGRDGLWRILPGQAWLLEALARSLADKLAAYSRTSAMNLLLPLEVRYAAYLWETCGASGAPVPIRLEETAGQLGASARQLQRVIRSLSDRGLVARQGQKLRILDRGGLDRLRK